MLVQTLAVLIVITIGIASPSNLCSTSGLCCKHRDGDCVAQRVYPNHTVDTSQLPCYCDHACLRLDDCCPDYRHFCSGTYRVCLQLARLSIMYVTSTTGNNCRIVTPFCFLWLLQIAIYLLRKWKLLRIYWRLRIKSSVWTQTFA
jgi:hypothetical protein